MSSAATDDVVQTVWLRLAEHCSKIRQPDRLASWLATTTRNEALRVIRGNTRQTPQAMSDDLAEPTAPSIEERVGDDATLRAVLQAFAKLSAEDQQLMRLLCAVPPIDYQTIAEMLGRPIGSIGPTRARCLERLRSSCRPASIRKKDDMPVSDDELLDAGGPGRSGRRPGTRPRARRCPGRLDVAHHRSRSSPSSCSTRPPSSPVSAARTPHGS